VPNSGLYKTNNFFLKNPSVISSASIKDLNDFQASRESYSPPEITSSSLKNKNKNPLFLGRGWEEGNFGPTPPDLAGSSKKSNPDSIQIRPRLRK
jgi:hypothetical protein